MFFLTHCPDSTDHALPATLAVRALCQEVKSGAQDLPLPEGAQCSPPEPIAEAQMELISLQPSIPGSLLLTPCPMHFVEEGCTCLNSLLNWVHEEKRPKATS